MGQRNLIRVCHVITLLELGGAQQNTLYTCSKLDPARFDVYLLAGEGGYLDGEAVRLLGERACFLPELVREIRPWKDLSAYRSLRRELKRISPAIVHTHSSKAGILGRAAARAAGIRHIIHSIHGFPFHDEQAWPVRDAYLTAEKTAARWTEAFVAVSRRNIEKGIELGLFGSEKVRLIRSGIDIEYFASASAPPDLRRKVGVPEGVPLIGSISCLKPQKAPLDFVDVCRQVTNTAPDAHFLLIGDGEMRPQVEHRVREAGLSDRLHMLGWREDVAELLHLLDVFVLTSHWEGLPRAVIQARAAGIAVVATAVDGTVEAVTDGESGYLCRPGDCATMASRIISLLMNPDRCRQMGESGRNGLVEFDQRTMVRQQEELYLELVAGSPEQAGAGE